MAEQESGPRRAHGNRQLFSNHFLERRLRGHASWREAADAANRLRDELRSKLADQLPALERSGYPAADSAAELAEAVRERPAGAGAANEPQTEERWIRPVLRALGWGWEVQPPSRRLGTLQFPDYALFRTQADADAAAAADDRRRVLKRADGVLEAKRWRRDLDGGGAADDPDPNRVPSTQIINYLIRAEQPWGILTNGVEWRVYYRDADFADTAYFAVDLPALLGDEPLALGEGGETIPPGEAFRYFYLFFRPEAFVAGAEGLRWLDGAYRSSVRYARAVEEALKPRAYRAVTALCRGFITAERIDASRLADDPALARTVLDNALTLLFRLLFVLYAESRDLLPVRTNAAYRSKSLLRLRERAARVRDEDEATFRLGRDFWNDLNDLFEIVDGDPRWRDVGIPVYNGGLFDPDKHPWLEEHYVADPEMAEALDLLSRTEDPDNGRLHFVDYSPLDVRHLGSIYEGLLEHVVRVASEDLDPIGEGGRVVRDAVPAGEPYLATEKGERKTTGSYYTPDYVVQYIVRRTLEPLVEGRSPGEILELTVLDPAMGSGHFLVAATAYLARAAVRAVEEHPQRSLGELGRLDPEHLRRLVVERCIFGVDKNPRAVELAKLSLWLATVQRDKPLNFLDHHLKCGDSLLGARVRELGGLPSRRGKEAALEAEGQFNAFESAFAQKLVQLLALVRQIEMMPSDTLDDVQRKERLYREADALLARFRDVADVWASKPFGNELKSSEDPDERKREGEGDNYARAVEALLADEDAWNAVRRESWFERAKALWREHRFFHWDIEFGEVFYDEKGRGRADGGFDAVVGNPPYVRMEEFKELKDFLRTGYETYETRSDLYVYFMERSLELLRDGGEYGVIVSNKFLRANYGKPLRALIGREASVREIVDFGGLPVFPDATVRAAIVALHKGSPGDWTPRFAPMHDLDFDRLEDAVPARAYDLDETAIQGNPWLLVPGPVARLIQRMRRMSTALGEAVDGEVLRGIVTGRNDAFFIDRATRDRLIEADAGNAEVIKPLVVGSEVRRYRIEREDHFILYLQHGIDIDEYPAIREYLEPYREALEKRATKQAWYELQQPQEAYADLFGQPKIVFPDMATTTRFAIDQTGLYPANTVYFIPHADRYLLALLNSRLALFYFETVCAALEGRDSSYLRFFGQYMEEFPARGIEETTPRRARDEMGAWLRSLYHRGLRLAGVEPEVPKEIRDLGERIGRVDDVERVVLIGSWARGQATDESDVDLLVVHVNDAGTSDVRRRVRAAVDGFERPVDVHLYGAGELAERKEWEGGFVARVTAEGVVLHDG